MTTSITQPLLTPVRMGDLDLRNSIVMAPLTRMRADNADRAPTELHARYFPANRFGVKTGPMNLDGAFVANDVTLPTSEYVIGRLNDYNLSHLLLMGATTDFSGTPLPALAATACSDTSGKGKLRESAAAVERSREEIQQSFEDYQLGRTGGLTP